MFSHGLKAAAALCVAAFVVLLPHSAFAGNAPATPAPVTAAQALEGITLPPGLRCMKGEKDNDDVWQRLGSTVYAAKSEHKPSPDIQKEFDESLSLYLRAEECTTAPTAYVSFVALKDAPDYPVN